MGLGKCLQQSNSLEPKKKTPGARHDVLREGRETPLGAT